MYESDIGNKEVFAANLNRQMKEAGESRAEVCAALGIKYSTFSDWCNAKKYPRIDTIERLAIHFGVNKSDLIERKKDSPSTERLSELKLRYIELVKAMPDDLVAQLLAIAEQAARTDG